MNITKIGKRIIPVVFTVSTLATGSAFAKNQVKDTLVREANKTELVVKEQFSNNKSLTDWGILFLYFGAGIFGGLAGSKIIRLIKDKKISSENEYFGNDFVKDSEKIYDYLEEVLNKTVSDKSYCVNFVDFANKTSFFTKKYLSKNEYINMFLKTVQDKSLDNSQKEILGQYLILKTVCTSENENLGIDELYSYFKGKNSYEELINELNIKKENRENPLLNIINTEKINKKDDLKEDDEENKGIVFDTVHHNLKFKDVGGQDEAIKILKRNILFPIKYPDAFKKDSINHGFILYGPPGTGKTLLSETLANESSANFIKINGNELTSKWVGESEENWRKLFKEAVEKQPTIILIDEFDGIASKRGKGDVYNDKIVNQILGLISDLEKNNNMVFLIATTNRLDMIDKAVLRAGRIGKHIELKAPQNKDDVKTILNIHLNKKVYSDDIDIDKFSEDLLRENVTGADIASIVNDAYEAAMDRNLIYEKMEDNTFDISNYNELKITSADLEKVILDFKNKNNNNKSIGFKK